jgi:AcrR family transcriptional regulator
MASTTRDKILKTALRMFNDLGFGAVTNEMLAEANDIAIGNLWYHFKTKRDLLEALTQDFVRDVEVRLVMMPTKGGDVLSEYAAMLHTLAEEIRKYRFLYRDQADYGEFTDTLLKALPRIYSSTFGQFRAFFRVMTEQGHLDWSADRLEDLVTAVIMILRYPLEFRRELGENLKAGSGAILGSFRLHLSLFEDRMSPKAAARLRDALALELA